MNPPCFTHRYTKGPDGTRGFSERRKLRGVLSTETSRRVPFLADIPRPVVTNVRSNALIFLAVILFLSCLQVAAAAASPFTVYGLNTNGFVHSTKVHHVNVALKAQNPHAFVLSESKTNSRTSQTLPDDYNIFEEPGVRADNHHLYKWGVIVGIRKSLQVAQRVAVTDAALRGRVVAVDIVLPTNDGRGFLHRFIGAYAPWDPGSPDGRLFWSALTTFVKNTNSSWTIAGDLNVTVAAIERPSDNARDRAPYLVFLNAVDGLDVWRNHPERNRDNDWTSGANATSTSGNIIDRVVTSARQTLDADISTLDRHQSFARIKYPNRTEKHRHDDFRNEIDRRLQASDLHDIEINDDASFTDVYQRFTAIMIPAAEKAYGRVARFTRRTNDRISTPKIEKLVARLRFTGGAIRAIRNPNDAAMSFGALTAFNCILNDYYATTNPDLTLLQFAILAKRQLHRDLYAARTAEIRARKERLDRARITSALRGGSTKRLVNPGEYIELPITIKHIHSDRLVSDPPRVKEITREYWSDLYRHEPPPDIPKPWLTTPSVLEIKQRVANDPFLWPRMATLADFRALLRKGTPRPAPGRDEWEKWIVKNLPDQPLAIVLKLHNYIVANASFPGNLKDMWLTMFHKRGLRMDLSNWRGLLISNFLANSPMSWLNFNLVTVYALKRDQMKGFDYLSPQGMYDAVDAYGLPNTIIDLDRAAQTDTKCFIRTAHGTTNPITISGLTKQGGSLSPIKSTLTTSLGHHYLTDITANDPDALVISSGRALDPHGPNDP
ncbi:hypothetical protein B0H13DRAFT_1642207 [Mycena leptocephala]|nr:hypothetical protein B0H13DRAFT_1642207 [Mycena leptocephala]